MSFDWQSFATGFMERTTEILKERQEEAKTFEEEQRAAAERNAATISRRRAIADQVTGYANYLQSNGVSNEQIQAVIASGPRAIEQLTERVQQAVTANGGRPLGTSDAEALITMPEGFSPVDMTTQEFIDQTYGLGVRETQPREDREFGFMDRLFGRDQMTRAQDRLNRTPFVEGMTIEEVNRVAQQGDYTSLIPGTFASVSAATTRYDPTEEGVEFATTLDQRLSRLTSNPEYIRALSEDGGVPGDNVREFLSPRISSLVNGYASRYREDFIADQSDYLSSIMGEEYVRNLMDTYVIGDEDTESTTEVKPPATTTEVIPPATTTEVTPPATGTEALSPAVGATPEEEEGITVTPLPSPSEERAPETSIVPRPAPRAETVVISEDPEVEEPPADATVNVEGGGTYTYEQWQNMSRQERSAAGLPVSFIGGQLYFNRFAEGLKTPSLVDSLVGPSTPGDPELRAQYDVLANEGVDDISINLLLQRGGDMLNYVIQKGSTTEEEIHQALVEYGQDNNLVMPFDKAALIYSLKSVLDEMP